LWARVAVLTGLLALTACQWLRNPDRARAEAADRSGETVQALTWALASLDRHPRDTSSARIAAHGLSQLLYPDEAEPYYERLRRGRVFGPGDAHARALGLTRSNRRAQAVTAYESILARTPDDPIALQRLAAVHWLRGDAQGALKRAERLARTPSGAVPGHAILAGVHHDLGNYEEAVRHFRLVAEIDPELRRLDQPEMIFWLEYGGDLIGVGRPAEARRVLRRAVDRAGDPALMDMLARACLEEGDAPEARRWWLRSSERDAGRVTPWLQLGRLELRDGSTEEALTYLERASRLEPDSYVVLSSLASAHRLLGHKEQASDYFARAARAKRPAPRPGAGMGADAVPEFKSGRP
jgi:tetratricopeptide (TPR) repeat protein